MRAQYLLPLVACFGAAAQSHPDANFDEAKVPEYTLPALLTLANGQPVATPQVWIDQRVPRSSNSTRPKSLAVAPPPRPDSTMRLPAPTLARSGDAPFASRSR